MIAFRDSSSQPALPIGKIKSFGAFGPKYEVGQAIRPTGNGDWMVRIKLVESGEEAEYRYSRLKEDPDAR